MSYSPIVVRDRARHKAALEAVANTPGKQRARALKVLTEIADGYAFSVGFGSSLFRSNGRGLAYTGKEIAADTEAGRLGAETTVIHEDAAGIANGLASELAEHVVPGSAPLNKRVGDIHIPCGVALIVARGGIGKTPLAHWLASEGVDAYGVVRIGEPLAGYSTNRKEAASGLAMAMVEHSDVVVDSIKDLLASDGAAMKGGISRSALLSISNWASVAATLGTTLYVPLNPSGDDDLVGAMVEVAKSNATLSIHFEKNLWNWSARTGEGLERKTGSFVFAGDKGVESAKQRLESADGGFGMKADPVNFSNISGVLSRTQSVIR